MASCYNRAQTGAPSKPAFGLAAVEDRLAGVEACTRKSEP
jgi:hypothetical protein